MTDATLSLDGSSLGLRDAWRVARGDAVDLEITDAARAQVRAARDLVDDLVRRGEVVYGVTTGFGRLENVSIAEADARELQRNLLRSHAVGCGDEAPPWIVRLLLLYRLNTLLRGHSGVRERTVDLLLALLKKDVLPVVPMQGSVGACGDLAPLAHLALVLQGEGEAWYLGERLSGAAALAKVGLEPLELAAKEGLALINGVQFTAAVGTRALERSWNLAACADIACAMTLEASLDSVRPFAARVSGLRPHPGQGEVGQNVRRMLSGSEILESHADCGRVQDRYSVRCAPQVHGAARDALRHLTGVISREINSVTDNPLLFPADALVVSAGNFHGEPLALPLDYAKAAVAELGSISERRIENLVNPDLSGLPPFLAKGKAGVNSGLMMAQVTAAALVSENKVLAHPASVDSIPTSASQEDHVSMSPIAARHFEAITKNTLGVLAIELLSAYFALHWRRPLRAGKGVEAAFELISTYVDPPGDDRLFKPDIDRIADLVDSGAVVAAVEAEVGPLRRGQDDGAP